MYICPRAKKCKSKECSHRYPHPFDSEVKEERCGCDAVPKYCPKCEEVNHANNNKI